VARVKKVLIKIISSGALENVTSRKVLGGGKIINFRATERGTEISVGGAGFRRKGVWKGVEPLLGIEIRAIFDVPNELAVRTHRFGLQKGREG